jgi:DNA-binding NtrC family response regulator
MTSKPSYTIRWHTTSQMSLRPHVAIIDDEVDLVELFSDALKLKGYSVRGFNSPLVALEHLYKHHSEFCLVLTDLRMPGMDGFQLAKLVYQLDKQIKIICMSAFEMYDNELNEVNMDEFLKKPIHISQLTEVIKKHLTP